MKIERQEKYPRTKGVTSMTATNRRIVRALFKFDSEFVSLEWRRPLKTDAPKERIPLHWRK